MNLGSLFSGLGGIDLAFEQAGFTIAWQVEIDPAATKILQRHWPEVPKYGDIREVDPADLAPVDVVVFGSPCTDMSVAGKRAGLKGVQSGLFYEAIRIIQGIRPSMALWENVPGAFSSNGGRDFGAVLTAFRDIGVHECAWRVLDARYFGVAQRRRRVFLVADFRGDRATSVLFEPESVSGDPPTRRQPGQVAPSLLASGAGTSRPAGIGSEADFLIPEVSRTLLAKGNNSFDHTLDTYIPEIAATLSAGSAQSPGVNAPGRRREDETNVIVMQDARSLTNKDQHGMGIKASETMYTLDATSQHAVGIFMAGQGSKAGSVAYSASSSPTLKAATSGTNQVPSVCLPEVTHTLRGEGFDASEDGTGRGTPLVSSSTMAVRRLLPVECERLQGLPDDHTRWDADGNELSDSARYRMIGNSVAVPVVRWIAERMACVLQGGIP